MMKRLFLALTLLLALTTQATAASQKHRHTPQQELTDTASQDAIEAYSDTTTTAAPPAATWDDDEDDVVYVRTGLLDRLSRMDADELTGLLLPIGVLLIIFVIAPVAIIVALFYFINKNRRDRLRLARMAMEQGQPIPDRLLEDKTGDDTDEYQKGLRQCFVGVGLMIFLGLTAEEVGFGIGALVFCIGLGKVVSAKMTRR